MQDDSEPGDAAFGDGAIKAALARVESRLDALAEQLSDQPREADRRVGELLDRLASLEEEVGRNATQVAQLGSQVAAVGRGGEGGDGGAGELERLVGEVDAVQGALTRLNEQLTRGLTERLDRLSTVTESLASAGGSGADMASVLSQIEMLGATTTELRMSLRDLGEVTEGVGEMRAALERQAAALRAHADQIGRSLNSTMSVIMGQASQLAEVSNSFDSLTTGINDQTARIAAAIQTAGNREGVEQLRSTVEALRATIGSQFSQLVTAVQQLPSAADEVPALRADLHAGIAALQSALAEQLGGLGAALRDIPHGGDANEALAAVRADLETGFAALAEHLARPAQPETEAGEVLRTLHQLGAWLDTRLQDLTTAFDAAPDHAPAIGDIRATVNALGAHLDDLAGAITTTGGGMAIEDLRHSVDSLDRRIGELGEHLDEQIERLAAAATEHAGARTDDELRALRDRLATELATVHDKIATDLGALHDGLAADRETLRGQLDQLSNAIDDRDGIDQTLGRLRDELGADMRAELVGLRLALSAVAASAPQSEPLRSDYIEEGLRAIWDRLEALSIAPSDAGSASEIAAAVAQVVPSALASSLAQVVRATRSETEAIQAATLDAIRKDLIALATTMKSATEATVRHVTDGSAGATADILAAAAVGAVDRATADGLAGVMTAIDERLSALTEVIGSQLSTTSTVLGAGVASVVTSSLDERLDRITVTVDDRLARLPAAIDASLAATNSAVERLDERLAAVAETTSRLGDVASKVDRVDDRLAAATSDIQAGVAGVPGAIEAGITDAIAARVDGVTTALGGRFVDIASLVDARLAAAVTAMDDRLRELTAVVEGRSTAPLDLSGVATPDDVEASTARLESSLSRLMGEVDDDLDEVGRRIEALASIVEQSLTLRDATRDRVAGDVGDRLSRLREAAAGVSDAVRAEAQRRRSRRPGPDD